MEKAPQPHNPDNSKKPTPYTNKEFLKDRERLAPIQNAKRDEEAVKILKEKMQNGGVVEIREAMHRQHAESLAQGYRPKTVHNPESEGLRQKAVSLNRTTPHELPDEFILNIHPDNLLREEARPALKAAIENALKRVKEERSQPQHERGPIPPENKRSAPQGKEKA